MLHNLNLWSLNPRLIVDDLLSHLRLTFDEIVEEDCLPCCAGGENGETGDNIKFHRKPLMAKTLIALALLLCFVDGPTAPPCPPQPKGANGPAQPVRMNRIVNRGSFIRT